MQFLTQVLGRPVFDNIGEPLGKVRDVLVSPSEPLPIVSAISISNGRAEVVVPWRQVREEVDRFSLPFSRDRVPHYALGGEDIWLRKGVLDRQIVDVHDHKVVRVNDVRFVETPGQVRLLGVDASTRGLLRELGLEWLARLIGSLIGRSMPEKVIAWNDVETLKQADGPIKLRIPLQKLSRLHPSDIADIIEQMNPMQRADVIESLDVQTAADVLPEASAEIQAEIIGDLDTERASDILEEMDPDEAADILGDLPPDRTEELLAEMQPEEAEDVRELLTYEDETAGGLMTNDFVSIPEDANAQGTIDLLRELKPDEDTAYYLYVTSGEGRLSGIISLRSLIVAKPETPIRSIMQMHVVHAHPEAGLREVGELFQKYNLLALPVLDYDDTLKGIITIDDMMEDVPSRVWRGRKKSKNVSEHGQDHAS
ncbi:MAG TPA: CBS domain-containing protein [Armatimonadota bacterium]